LSKGAACLNESIAGSRPYTRKSCAYNCSSRDTLSGRAAARDVVSDPAGSPDGAATSRRCHSTQTCSGNPCSNKRAQASAQSTANRRYSELGKAKLITRPKLKKCVNPCPNHTSSYAPWTFTRRISEIDWIVAHIGIEIYPALGANRIGLQETPEGRTVSPGAVVVEAGIGIEALSGKAEGRAARRSRRLPIGAVGIALDHGAGVVTERDGRAERIAMMISPLTGDLHNRHNFAEARAGHEAPDQCAEAVVFSNFLSARIVELRDRGAGLLRNPAAKLIEGIEYGQRRGSRYLRQAVLGIVNVAVGSIEGKVAVAIVGRQGAGDRIILVEIIRGVIGQRAHLRAIDLGHIGDILGGTLPNSIIKITEAIRATDGWRVDKVKQVAMTGYWRLHRRFALSETSLDYVLIRINI